MLDSDVARDREQENQYNLHKLLLSVKSSLENLNLLVAICDNPSYRDEIIQTYERELQHFGVNCCRVKVDRVLPSLKESLQAFVEKQSELGNKTPSSVPTMVTVLGVSDLLDLRFTEQKSPRERFLFSVQWTREALLAFQFPIVLWVTERIATELAKYAPDFWSWRGGVFEFVKPIDWRTRSSDLIVPDLPKVIPSEPLADIEELQQQIEELKALEPDSPLLGSLYQMLGRTYFQKVQRGVSESSETDLQRAIASFERAVREYEKADRQSDLAFALAGLGYIQKSLGLWQQAEVNFQKALHLYEELGDRAGMASSWGQLGDIERNRGNWEAAEQLYRQCLQVEEELGDRAGMASSWGQLGDIERNRGNWEAAEQLYRQCLQVEEELGDRAGMATSWGLLGDIERNRGNWDAAERLFRQSLQLREELGDRSGMATSWGCLGENELLRGNLELAEVYSQRGLQMAEAVGDTYLVAEICWDLARLYKQRNNSELAQPHYQTARHLFTQLGAAKDLERIEREWENEED